MAAADLNNILAQQDLAVFYTKDAKKIIKVIQDIEASVSSGVFASGITTDTITEYTSGEGTNINGVNVSSGGIAGVGHVISGAISTNTITERSIGVGVTADGVLLKDSKVLAVAGTVSGVGVAVGVGDTGMYRVSATQLGFAVEGSLKGGFNTNGAYTDVIEEQTSTVGVTVDGVLLKDGGVTLADAADINFDTTTGSKIGGSSAQKLALWGVTPDEQPTTGIVASAYAAVGGTNVDSDDTFGGYTIGQVVAALKRAGILA